MRIRLDRLFKRALKRIEIVQAAQHAQGVSQVLSVTILLNVDPELRQVTNSLVTESATSLDLFQQITERLQDIDPKALSPAHADLASAWLRKIVALNHIRLGKRWFDDTNFSMYMLDTSFADQPHGAWLQIDEFLQVVEADGHIATAQRRRGLLDSLLRVFFVPSGEYMVSSSEYLMETIRDQATRNITVCVSRADCAAKNDASLLGDGFCIAERVLCEIDKPSWKFATTTDRAKIASFVERVRTIAVADYSIIIRVEDLKHLDELLLELAVQ